MKRGFREKDIEDWLYKNPKGFADEWIARQYRVPSGIIDLLGVYKTDDTLRYPMFHVVEVKNIPITSNAITQVCRYSNDIYEILWHASEGYVPVDRSEFKPTVIKTIVTTSNHLSKRIMYEAESCNVRIQFIKTKQEFKLTGRISFSKYHIKKDDEYYHLLSQSFIKYYSNGD